MNFRKANLLAVVALAAATAAGLYFYEFEYIRPCEKPITYSIGPLDARFGVSKAELIHNIERAAGVWSAAVNRPLFA